MTVTDAWPLFGLRLPGERIVLRLPTDGEILELISLAKAGIHPVGEMPFRVAWSTIRARPSNAGSCSITGSTALRGRLTAS
jgi:hypothetical protein